MKLLLTLPSALLLLASCATPRTQPTPTSTPFIEPNLILTQDQAATLGSLELVDEHPLYTMHYVGSYGERASSIEWSYAAKTPARAAQGNCQPAWGCSLFAALGDEENRLFGRNFDWQFSPALLLFTDSPDGYASVSMVDIEYLGFEGDRSRNLEDLSLEERRPLLDAPFLPFDGMNERGLAIAMAAVPAQEMPYDPQKQTIGHLEVIREILDHAGSVEEAIELFGSYNIDMGNVPLHYLLASAMGDSALVEFYEGEMVVFGTKSPWQSATNFLVASANGHPQGECRRYDRINQQLEEFEGQISSRDAFGLLGDVSQDNTQWSIVYHMSSGDLEIIMGGNYSGNPYNFRVEVPAG
jgi:hypothetical protein